MDAEIPVPPVPMRQEGAESLSGAYPPGTEDYTAASIRVLDPVEQQERFSWVRAQALAAEFPWTPRPFWERLLVACELSGQDPEVAIRRYALQSREVLSEEFYACYAQLVQDARWR